MAHSAAWRFLQHIKLTGPSASLREKKINVSGRHCGYGVGMWRWTGPWNNRLPAFLTFRDVTEKNKMSLQCKLRHCLVFGQSAAISRCTRSLHCRGVKAARTTEANEKFSGITASISCWLLHCQHYHKAQWVHRGSLRVAKALAHIERRGIQRFRPIIAQSSPFSP